MANLRDLTPTFVAPQFTASSDNMGQHPMASKRRLPPPKHFQSVVEWRYPKTHRYWDDCGKAIAKVEQAFEGLVCQGLLKEGFRFEGQSAGLSSAVFAWDRANVTQTGIGESRLAASAERFFSVISDQLEISQVQRLGHRTWSIYEMQSAREAEHWLGSAEIWQFSKEESAMGQPTPNGIVLRTNQSDGRRLRMEIGAGTLSSKSPSATYHGVIVDIDIVVDAPSDLIRETAAFVDTNVRFLREVVDPFFGKK